MSLLEENDQLMQRALKFKEEMSEERRHMTTRLEELRAQKYQLIKQRNEQVR